MGIYLNPSDVGFKETLDGKIYDVGRCSKIFSCIFILPIPKKNINCALEIIYKIRNLEK